MTWEEKAAKLRAALIGLVGASEQKELEAMEAMLRALPSEDPDKIAAANAIHALIETME